MEETKKILLILDLDETLIHARETPLVLEPDFCVFDYSVYKRPNLAWFLNKVSESYRLAVWSSADDEYVEAIVDQIKPESVDLEFVWGQSKCTLRRDYDLDKYIKEKRLKKLKKYGNTLEQMLIVDDTPKKLKDNYGNAIYIKPFKGNPSDDVLLQLYGYLELLKNEKNVRKIEKRGWMNKYGL